MVWHRLPGNEIVSIPWQVNSATTQHLNLNWLTWPQRKL